MKKLNLLIGLGLFAASLTAQAQTVIYQNGFENADKPEAGKYSSAYALTKGVSMWGDWVNPKDVDTWTEQATDAHSGEYCFSAENGYNVNDNGEESAYSWDRGFKIANLKLKENTPYRVSFWLQTNGEAKVSSWLSQGIENFDKSICTPDGTNFGIDSKTLDTEGQWKRYSFVSYYAGQAPMLSIIENQSWVGSATFPAEFGGQGETYKAHFDNKFPDENFFIINMFSNSQSYLLDDIKIEEGVTFGQATFNMDAIRLDFGYNTNIAELANANSGFFSLDPSCVTVSRNGEELSVDAVEGKSDGYLYIFLTDEADPEDVLTVSFTPAADCPIQYVGQKRPSTDYEAEMQVLGFTNETAVLDEAIDVVPSSWSDADFVSSIPENNSFDLRDDEIKTVTFTYNKKMSLGSDVTATLAWSDNYGTYNKDLSEGLALSDDAFSYIVTMPQLADGDYKVIISGATNEMGIPSYNDNEICFSKGEALDGEEAKSETIFATDFDNDPTNCVPQGWYTINEAGVHKYGFNDDGSQLNYGWGGNPGGGGARLYEGFSGDFKKALYWGSRGTTEGYASFGELVKDYLDDAGNLADDAPEGISLWLDPRKYQISFQMAAWKSEPIFRFTLEDLEGNVYAKFNDYKATPNMDGKTGKVTGSLKCSTDFTVEKEGYYILKFAAQDATWQEYLLANVKLITMPSKSAYYKNMLAEAVEAAQPYLDNAADATYDGDTKSALAEAIRSAKEDRFTQGSKVEELCATLATLCEKMDKRVNNIDDYSINLALAQDAATTLVESNPDYAEHAKLLEAQQKIKDAEAVNPSSLDDDALDAAVTALKNLAAQIEAIPNSTAILTWGASQAIALANQLGADTNGAEKLIDDNREVIAGTNANSKGALYAKIAAGEDLDQYMTSVYNTAVTAEEWDDNDPNYDENGHPLLFKGINLSGYIYNAHLYRVYGEDGVPGWTVKLGGGEGYTDPDTGEEVEGESINIGYSATPSETEPVVDTQINIYGKTNYDFSQVIEGLPAGIYNVVLQTRTPRKYGNGVFTDEEIYYNAQDAEGTWDKYIYAQGDADAAQQVAPFIGADGLSTTLVENVNVKDGQLTMGAHEYYVSGVARTWEPASDAETDATDGWLGTSYVDYANIYFIAPLPGFDYAAAAVGIMDKPVEKTISSVYNVAGTRVNNMQKGINIVKYNDGSVRKLFVK